MKSGDMEWFGEGGFGFAEKNSIEVPEGAYIFSYDNVTNLFTRRLSNCRAITIATQQDEKHGRLLTHTLPGAICVCHLTPAKNFINQRGVLIKKASIVSSMGFRGHLDSSDLHIIEMLKRYFDEANICSGFSFDFMRASRVAISNKGIISEGTKEETIEHINATYGAYNSPGFAEEILDLNPSFKIM